MIYLLQNELDKVGNLKHQVKVLTEKEEEASERVKSLQIQLQQKKVYYEKLLTKLHKEKLGLEEQLADVSTYYVTSKSFRNQKNSVAT